MRTESEIRSRLEEMKKEQKGNIEFNRIWSAHDLRCEIRAIEWVLGGDEK